MTNTTPDPTAVLSVEDAVHFAFCAGAASVLEYTEAQEDVVGAIGLSIVREAVDDIGEAASDYMAAHRPEINRLAARGEESEAAWLPNVLCPTDGVWRAHKLPDGREVVACFDGYSLGVHASRWRVKELAYHNPARPSGEVHGGVEQVIGAYDTFVIQDLPEGVYPTHFRPNDTVHGAPK